MNQEKTHHVNQSNNSKIIFVGIIISLLVLLIISFVPTIFISQKESLYLLGFSLGWLIGTVFIIK
tara:strand:+ start:72 stop:266 length:195 start_codon:yes stop_codon:yes gene_type:complete